MPYTPVPPFPTRLLIIGGGGHALVVAEAALEAGHILAGFLDDNPQAVIAAAHPGIPYMGRLADLPAGRGHTGSILAVGNLAARRVLLAQTPEPRAVVHPQAGISPSATIAPGAFVAPHAVVHTLARIGPHAIINTGAIIEHECDIGENTHIAPGAVLGGRVKVGPDTLVGLGARILPNLAIGRGCTVGAGAVVTRNLPDHSVVVGVPARQA